MRTIARFAIRRRWWIIIGWIAFILLAQGVSGSLGGADYKDTFSLPHTETQTVMQLLNKAGESDQSGISGQVVLHAKQGTLSSPPAGAAESFAALCDKHLNVIGVSSPWASLQCVNGAASPGPAQPSLLSKDRTTAIVNVTGSRTSSTSRCSTACTTTSSPCAARPCRSSSPATRSRGRGSPRAASAVPARLHRRARRSRDRVPDDRGHRPATGQRRRGADHRPGSDRRAHPCDGRLERHAAADRADGDRRGCRLRAVHRHPAPPQPAPRHERPRTRSNPPSTPRAAPSCSRARRSASRCSG